MEFYIEFLDEQNDQLGAAATRQIEIVGTGKVRTYGESVDGLENVIAEALKNQGGWRIYNLDFRQTDWFSLDGMDFDVNIKAEVPNEYTNDNHVNFVSGVINNARNLWGNNTFTDIRLRTFSPDKPNYVAPKPSSKPTASTGNNPSNPNNPGGGYNPDGKDPKAKTVWEQIAEDLSLTKLFGTTGVTVGVIGAIMVTALILKR